MHLIGCFIWRFSTLFWECFDNRIINMGLKLPCLPDPDPCNFHLWVKLEGNEYSNTPHTEHKLYQQLRVQCLIKIHHHNSDMKQILWLLYAKHVCKLKKTMSSSIFKCDKQKPNISSSTRSPFLTWFSRLAQSGRWSSFRKWVWFSESNIVLVIYLLHVVLFAQYILDIK